jgi:coenzyme F420-0:L-glutamate ligase
LPDVRPDDDLAALLADGAPDDLADGDVLVVAHKVVSKAEGRLRLLREIEPGERASALAEKHGKNARLVQAILDESAAILRAHEGTLICETHRGFVCANAGVDQSNASREGELILLPADPDGSARRLRAALAATLGVHPAVVVADSFGRAWRLGQTDVAIGAAALVLALDPELVVLGGGFSRSADVLQEPFRKELDKLCIRTPEVLVSALGDESVALGATKLALDHVDGLIFDPATGLVAPGVPRR